MRRPLGTVTFRLAVGYGLLLAISMAVISAVFYFGTVGLLGHRMDSKIGSLTRRLVDQFEAHGSAGVRDEIEDLLSDGVDSDTEIYLFVAPDGSKIVGNVTAWLMRTATSTGLSEGAVTRLDRQSDARMLVTPFRDGSKIVVGFDLQDQHAIEGVVWRAVAAGSLVALLLAIGGAILFRRLLERRVAAIRRTALEIGAGDMTRRVPLLGAKDEFARLGEDVNHMLDRIEQLMDGVRHVSNAIAHDLRTPLGRVRAQLDEALRPGIDAATLTATTRSAIHVIDELIAIFDRLLQIAEAESGARRHSFEPVACEPLITDVVELYDAEAERKGITLLSAIEGDPLAFGDRHLLASAIANLVDNALKYAGAGTIVRVRASEDSETISLIVEDNGPGIAAEERPKVLERFYRLDGGRNQPGNGLGLSIVAALVKLHEGSLALEDAEPGLRVRIRLPRLSAPVRRLAERQRRYA